MANPHIHSPSLLIRTVILLPALLSLLTGCGSRRETPEIKILWAEWRPSEALAELGRLYEAKSGVSVKVVKKSWDGAFGDATFSEFRNRDDNYDIIIGDSQWMGLGVVGGHYLELTDWMKENVKLDELEPAALKWYCEYPKGAARYYAVPCEADAMAWAYRKDLFEDPGHRAGFARYLAANKVSPAFPLAPPGTWDQLRWIARYFKQAVPGMAGLVMPTSRNYDVATMSFEPVMWSFGGDFGDYLTNRVTIDSRGTVNALRFYADLMQTTSAGGRNMGYGEVSAEYIAGRAAMACNFFAFFPAIANPGNNPDFYDKTGYFNSPSHTDASGASLRAVALGGQGMSVNAHISPERQARAKEFLKWFLESGNQQLWAEKGGFSSNKRVLASPSFKKAAPYNPLFEEAFQLMRDFWSVPEYDDLMKSCQREFCAVFQDGADPVEAVKQIQAEHEAILRKHGRIQ
ncbi:MAG: sugar transporter substrate-binding protein [Fibrobacteres bacterium]|nr:sugar transporter substrate-binding protein [Fibrobacterota bacterium]